MEEFLEFFLDYTKLLINQLNMPIFEFNGLSISLWAVFLGFLFLSIVISLFWKGGRG